MEGSQADGEDVVRVLEDRHSAQGGRQAAQGDRQADLQDTQVVQKGRQEALYQEDMQDWCQEDMLGLVGNQVVL